MSEPRIYNAMNNGNPYRRSMKPFLDRQSLVALRTYDQVRYGNKLGKPAQKGDVGSWKTSRGKSSHNSRTS